MYKQIYDVDDPNNKGTMATCRIILVVSYERKREITKT
jgi:hypothetical protein